MFTGIITAVGTVAALEPKGGDVRLRVQTGKLPLDDVARGDSIAVSGLFDRGRAAGRRLLGRSLP